MNGAKGITNDRKKYSVGENAGMKINDDGGIEIYVAADKPEGVPKENWLPINRKDENIDIVLRVYVPDLEKMKTWTAPKAEIFKAVAGKGAWHVIAPIKVFRSWRGDYPMGGSDER